MLTTSKAYLVQKYGFALVSYLLYLVRVDFGTMVPSVHGTGPDGVERGTRDRLIIFFITDCKWLVRLAAQTCLRSPKREMSVWARRDDVARSRRIYDLR